MKTMCGILSAVALIIAGYQLAKGNEVFYVAFVFVGVAVDMYGDK